MSGFDALKNLRMELPSGEQEKVVVINKKKIISKTEEERATADWLKSFGDTGVINKNGIRKFVANSSQPKESTQQTRATAGNVAPPVVGVNKPIIKTVADDDELLRLMGGE